MRVTGGLLRSRRIQAPRGGAVRPTPGRVKEALFSILGARVREARVLDLYAGSGALGFEAISRGASEVTFVEAHRATAQRIERTAEELGVRRSVRVVAMPALRAVGLLEAPYDLVFADPPYAQAFPAAVLRALRSRGLLRGESVVLVEHSARRPVAEISGFRMLRNESYGEVGLTLYGVDGEV